MLCSASAGGRSDPAPACVARTPGCFGRGRRPPASVRNRPGQPLTLHPWLGLDWVGARAPPADPRVWANGQKVERGEVVLGGVWGCISGNASSQDKRGWAGSWQSTFRGRKVKGERCVERYVSRQQTCPVPRRQAANG